MFIQSSKLMFIIIDFLAEIEERLGVISLDQNTVFMDQQRFNLLLIYVAFKQKFVVFY